MQVTISANGKNIKAEISEEQAKILGLVEDNLKQDMKVLELEKHIILLM